MLADDQTRDRFEDFTSAHHRARIQLRGRHRALARRAGDPDQARHRVLDVGDIAKRVRAGDDDVSAQRQRQHGVGIHGDATADGDRTSQHAEVEEAVCELGVARRHILETVTADVVGNGRQLHAVDDEDEINRDAGKRRPGLIENAAADTTQRVRVSANANE